MSSYVAKPSPPNQDKRWKLVDATIRRQGQQARGLIETLHTVQEAFGFDEQVLCYVAMSLRVPLSRVYGVATWAIASIPRNTFDYIGAKVEPWSCLKSAYYKPKGFPDGIYRVGTLARLNVADRCGTPKADQELAEFHELQRTAVLSSFHDHHARLIEILYCVERMEQFLSDPEILSKHVRAQAQPNALEGVGACEAPRGTLFRHYKIDDQGLIRWANLVIATGHNNLAMNRSVLQVAKHFVHGKKLAPGMPNRVEAVIRCYDPCLSCSTHALGQMPLAIQLVSPEGEVLDQLVRN